MAFLRNHPWTRWGRYVVVGVFALALLVSLAVPRLTVRADAVLTITPLTWNVIGLDSNNPTVGPNDFPIGVKVCNNSSGSTQVDNVTALLTWVDPVTGSTSTARIDPYDTNVWLRDGSLGYAANPFPGVSLAQGACTVFYFEVMVNRVAGAYSTTTNPATRARYFITASGTAGGSPVSVDTVKPRELYVERLISQSRNAVTSVWLSSDMTNNADCSNDAYFSSIPAGGTMTLTKGSDYCIKVVGSTATNGYEQLESFITLPNRIFQILSVNTVYATNNSNGHVPNPNPQLYGDACVWDNDPNSPTYRSCLSTGKVGNAVTIRYKVHILNVGSSNPEPMSTLLYDFSGSSYHYNSDFSFSTRYVYILTPADLTITKQFVPATVLPGGTSTMIVTIGNTAPSAVTGIVVTDGVNPLLPGGMTIAGSQPATPLIGCGSGSLTTTGSSFTFQDGTISANSSCIIKVNVTVPSGTTGSVPYDNTTGHLLYNTNIDTLKTASATLTATAAPACIPNMTLATWNMGTGAGTVPPSYSYKAGTVSAAVATGSGLNSSTISTSNGNPANSWGISGFKQTTANPDTSPYVQFQIDTSNFTGVSMTLDFDRASDWDASTNRIVIYSSTTGASGSFSEIGRTLMTTAWPVPPATSGTYGAASTGTGSTYFRITAINANNPNALVYLDNVTFTGCGTPAPAPTISKGFSPSTVPLNGTSTLTFTLSNTATGNVAQTGVRFTDTLPTGVQVAATPAASTTCGGTPTWGPTAGATTLTFGSPNGATIPAGGSCTVQVNVTPTIAGPFNNVSGYLSSDQSGTTNSLATATLSTILPPVISKTFGTSPILQNGTTSLTFTLTNPNQSGTLTGIGFADTFPSGSGLQVAATPSASTTCTGSPTWAPAAGDTTLTFGSTSLAAGASCTVSVNVTGTLATTSTGLTNVSGNVTSTEAGNGNTASATLVVNAQTAKLSVLKQIGTTATGPWGPVAAIVPPTSVYYRFTLENDGDVPLTNASVVDTWLSTTKGASMTPCTGLTVPVGSASVDPFVTCVIGPVSIAVADPSTYTNTAHASASSSLGAVTSNDSSATYNAAALALTKNVSETYFQAAGDLLHYSYTVTNSGSASLLGPVTISDDKLTAEGVTVTCQAVTAVGDLDSYLDPGEQVACPATGTVAYTVTSADVQAKLVTNTASASAGGITSNTVSKTVPLIPDLTATKTNDLPALPGNTMALGGSFNWTVQVSNASSSGPAVFTSGQKLLVDNLPAGPTYPASATVTKSSGVTTGTGAITCSIASNVLTCIADGDTVTIPGGDWFKAQFSVTPAAIGTLVNPDTSGGGKCQADPDNLLVELDDTNNGCSNTVTVYAPPTVTKSFTPSTITSGGTSSLQIVVTNPAGNPGNLTGVSIDDVYTGTLVNNAAGSVVCSATGSATLTGGANGGTSVGFSGGTIVPGGNCTITQSVSATTTNINNTTAPAATGPVSLSGTAANATLTVTYVPTLTKAFAASSIASGGNTDLTLSLGNANSSAITLTSALVDTFPTGMTINSATVGGTCTGVSASIGDTSLTIPSGTSIPAGGCTVIVNVKSTTAGTATNTIPAGALKTTVGNNADAAEDTLDVYAAPTLTKAFGAASINVGSGTTLTLTLTNPPGNPGALTGLQVDDTFPGGLTLADTNPTLTPLSCGTVTRTDGTDSQVGDSSVRFYVATLAVGSSCRAQLNVVSSAAGAVTNTTNAPTAAGPVALTGIAASAGLTVNQATPSIATQLKLASDDSNLTNPILTGAALYDTAALTSAYNAGGTVTYKIYSNNTCTTLVQDVTPTINTVVAGVFPPSTSYTFSSAGSFWYQAVYSGDANNTGAPSVCTSEPVTVAASSIELTKTATLDDSVVAPTGVSNAGDTVTYGFSVHNTGGVTITGITVTDPRLSGLVCAISSLAAGDTTACAATGNVYTLTQADINAGHVDNTATATGTAPGGGSVSDADSRSVTLAAAPELTVEKSSLTTSISAPGSVSYSYLVTNTGNVAVTSIAATDNNIDVSSLSCPATSLAVGADMTCTATHTVTQAEVDAGGNLSNEVTVTSSAPTVTDTLDIPITRTPALTLTKTATLDDTVVPPSGVANTGDKITYTFSVENTGNVTITGITVTDPLLPSLSCAIASLAPGASTSCTATGNVYTLVAADLTAKQVENTATATGTGADGSSVSDTDTKTVPILSIDAVNDSGTTVNGTTGGQSFPNVLTNDTLNGTTPATLSNVILTQVLPIDPNVTLNPADGSVNVAAGTDPGTYTVTYQICDKLNPTVCDTATVTVPVVTIEAKDDTGTPINNATGGTSIVNVLANNGSGTDLLNGLAADIADVNISVYSGPWPTGLHLDTLTGAVTVDIGTTPGTYTPQYQICDKLNPTICSTATVTVEVNAPPVASADLSITKTDGSTTYTPGGSITYTITVTNNGTSDVTGATVADTIPANITGATWTCTADLTASCTASGSGNINDSAVNLPSGKKVTYTVSGTVLSSATGTLSNTATVAPPTGITDPDSTNNSALDEDSASVSYDLGVTKTDGKSAYTPGGSTTYTITVHNSGPSDASGVSFSDDIPAEITSWTWSCVPDSGATCTLSGGASVTDYTDTISVPSGKSVTYTVVAQIVASASGDLVNTAQITAASDSSSGNNSATDTDTLSASADLSITKDDGSLQYTPGNGITYTIVVSNGGPSNVTGATVTDTVPAEITGVTWTCLPAGSSSCTASGSGNINDSVNIPALSSVTYTLTGTVSATATGNLTNTATVAAPEDGNAENNTASDTDTQVDIIDPAIAKGVDPAQAAIGETVKFTLLITNNGTIAANNVVVTDNLPDNLDYVSAELSRTAPLPVVDLGPVPVTPPRTVTYTIPTVNPGDIFKIEIVTVVNGLGKPPVQNQASLTADPAGPGVLADPTANNTASAVFSVGTGSVAAARSRLWTKDLTIADIPITGFPPNVVTTLPPQPQASAYQDEASVRLEIPRLKINLPIVGIPYAKNTWDVTWLANQAGWLQGTAFPSWPGNSVLTGHVYLANGLPGPFLNVHTLQWGDQVIVHVGGQRYIFEVRSDQVLSPNDRSVLAHETYPWLTLLTCKDYKAASKTYAHRVAVRAVLIKVEPDSSVRNDWR